METLLRKKSLWERWKAFGKKIGDFQARVLLVFFYFVILAPFALLVRLCSDPLAIKRSTQRGWRHRAQETESSMERATKQF